MKRKSRIIITMIKNLKKKNKISQGQKKIKSKSM